MLTFKSEAFSFTVLCGEKMQSCDNVTHGKTYTMSFDPLHKRCIITKDEIWGCLQREPQLAMEQVDFGKLEKYFLVETLILTWIILFNSCFPTSVLFKPDNLSGLLGALEAHHTHLYRTSLVIMKSVWSTSVSNSFHSESSRIRSGPSVDMMKISQKEMVWLSFPSAHTACRQGLLYLLQQCPLQVPEGSEQWRLSVCHNECEGN